MRSTLGPVSIDVAMTPSGERAVVHEAEDRIERHGLLAARAA